MKSLFKLDFVTILVLGVYFIFSVIGLIKHPILLDANYVVSLLLGIVSIILFFRLLIIVTSFSLHLKFLTLLFFSLLYMLGTIYNYRTGGHADFALFIDNASELIYFESSAVVFDIFTSIDILILLLISLTLLLSQILKKKLSAAKAGPLRLLQLPIILVFYGAIVMGPVPAADAMTNFLQGAVDYYQYSSDTNLSYKYQQIEKSDDHPFFNVVDKKNAKVKPHIILIILESFNANWVEKKTPEGEEVTPFFNSLVEKGYFVNNFYSNSIQTGKGHFATLCSLLPLSQGKAFVRYADNNFYCLPQLLKDFGYSTIFFQGNRRVNFDNSYRFLKKNGFDQFITPNLSIYPKPVQKEIVWGWGLQDNFLYQQALFRMDLELEKNKKPVFMTVATVSNHMRFNHVPKDQRILYSEDQGDPKKQYLNSLRLADEYLKSFFNELKSKPYQKNCLVIITSDHGFPVGEHDNYYPESHAYQESFAIPLLLLWPDKLPILRDTEQFFSQIDIAPTILDILGIEMSNHFLGESIFKVEGARHQYLIQPYDGLHHVIIQYPYKYIFHHRNGRESLFDLAQDPLERNNIASKTSSNEILFRMRDELSLFYLNDLLISQNRVMPQQ